MMYGDQRERVDLSFASPAVCAQEVEQRKIEIGLVPVAEVARQHLEILPGLGIACCGAVRSILLLSKVPWKQVRTLAADANSRTSVRLASVILREQYGVEPRVMPQEPDFEKMLATADAALIIGDPALRIAPEKLSFECLDLGAEWFMLTGLPMVFALWAGKPGIAVEPLSEITLRSYAFGKSRLRDIVEQEHASRGISQELAEKYLREHIRYELGAKEHEGLETFVALADLSSESGATPAIRAAVRT